MAPPLCFVLMPFGKKVDTAGKTIDFDAVYADVIKPAIADAGLDPIRADEEKSGGIIQKPMFERLILCPFAVADLTTANANVFYELGVRHAVRPASTVLLFAQGGRLPFDVADLRAVGYELNAAGVPADAQKARDALANFLREARRMVEEQAQPQPDSPVFTLLDNFPSPVAHLSSNTFQDRVQIAARLEEELRGAKDADALKAFEANLGKLSDVEAAVVVKLLLAYRASEAWQSMIDLVAKMPKPLAMTVLVQEQLSFALNRAGRSDDAERVLTQLLDSRGGTSETWGLLGRVYKDRWQKNKANRFLAKGLLEKAIDAYAKGFEADWRDSYPGVNAVSLMEIHQPPDPRRLDILPVVRYATLRQVASGKADYFDYATMVELAVVARNEAEATDYLTSALPLVREKWEPKTTLNNLNMIHEARQERGEAEPPWIAEVMQALDAASQ